ncbi:aldose 1-epimerase family protein [Pseudoxanthobacter sp.]|uniref:aldose 1-epimerase family protein n=1 Tax=Pseudoxanthobacter sp. TaxID=1925742 RepID=UPI002FE3A618
MSDAASGAAEIVSIAAGPLTAAISALGAELQALRLGETDLMWNGDPAVWAGRAPILFPVVGELAGGEYRLNGRSFPLARHGFARRRVFEVAERTPHSVLFRLTDDAASRAVYPFAFTLDVRFTLTGAALEVAVTVTNGSAGPMPACFGFHPAFLWPLPGAGAREDHAIVFEADEPAPLRRLGPNGLVEPAGVPTPVEGRRLALRDGLFAHDALVFDAPASRRVRYGGAGGPSITVGFPLMPQLGIWTRPGAGYVCIEPWHGIADSEGFTGDFAEKTGAVVIAPGESHAFGMTIGVSAAG